MSKKPKINNQDYIKLKMFLHSKRNNEVKSPQNQEKYMPTIYLIRCQHPNYIRNSHDSIAKNPNNVILKCAKDLNRHFSKEDNIVQMVNRHVERCSTSLKIREMQMKITLRYRLACQNVHQQKDKIENAGENMEKREPCALFVEL